MRLPVRLGGFGLVFTHALLSSAWLGSWALCLAAVVDRTGLVELTRLGRSGCSLGVSLRRAEEELVAAGVTLREENKPLLPPWESLAVHPAPKRQHALTHARARQLRGRLLDTLAPEDQARLRSCG